MCGGRGAGGGDDPPETSKERVVLVQNRTFEEVGHGERSCLSRGPICLRETSEES